MGERETNLLRDPLGALIVLATMPAHLVIPCGEGMCDRCGDDDGRKAAAAVVRVGVDTDLATRVNSTVGQTPAHRLAAVEEREAEAAGQEGFSRAPVAGRSAPDVMALEVGAGQDRGVQGAQGKRGWDVLMPGVREGGEGVVPTREAGSVDARDEGSRMRLPVRRGKELNTRLVAGKVLNKGYSRDTCKNGK
nr:hypothetical protein [Oscillochloris sp. ZM17-4]